MKICESRRARKWRHNGPIRRGVEGGILGGERGTWTERGKYFIRKRLRK